MVPEIPLKIGNCKNNMAASLELKFVNHLSKVRTFSDFEWNFINESVTGPNYRRKWFLGRYNDSRGKTLLLCDMFIL